MIVWITAIVAYFLIAAVIGRFLSTKWHPDRRGSSR